MDGDFELNKKGWYTVQVAAPNEFLNAKLDSDMYGIWYTVQFQGDAQTHLWQAKTAPEPGQRVYGHLEKTSSGKSTKFRRAKREDTPQDGLDTRPGGQSTTPSFAQAAAKYAPKDDHTQESIARSVALKASVDALGENSPLQEYLRVADEFLAWLQGSSEPTGIQPAAPGHIHRTEASNQVVNPARPWERITKQADAAASQRDTRDERDEYNDMRQSYEEPMPDFPGDM